MADPWDESTLTYQALMDTKKRMEELFPKFRVIRLGQFIVCVSPILPAGTMIVATDVMATLEQVLQEREEKPE